MTNKIIIPSSGEQIQINSDKSLEIPNNPIIPFIEGDGIGVDITPVMMEVVDQVNKKAYQNTKKINWVEVYAGEKAASIYGDDNYLPDETLDALKKFVISIKGPLATPVSGGIRSLNVAMRQKLDLFVCLRPIVYYKGVPSPLKHPEKTNMVIFRENTEDIYAGIEWPANSEESAKLVNFISNLGIKNKIRFPNSSAIGIKPVSIEGSKRLIRKAIQFAIDNNKKSVTLVHKGNIMKFTEGGFKTWGYELAQEEFNAKFNDKKQLLIGDIEIKDCIADAFLQEILLRPERHDVVATLNLNGDYISDALAAQVGGIGISPGANLSDTTIIFEATHGTAPDIAGKNIANPSSIILSAQMMLNHLGWQEAAEILDNTFRKTLEEKKVTADFSAYMGTQPLSTNEFGKALINNIN
jgi:isocitrate dehydrogenase